MDVVKIAYTNNPVASTVSCQQQRTECIAAHMNIDKSYRLRVCSREVLSSVRVNQKSCVLFSEDVDGFNCLRQNLL